MKKGIIILLTVIPLLLVIILGYRWYAADVARKEAEIRANEQAQTELRRREAGQKAAAEAEARRLADLKARQEAEEAEQRLAQTQADQAAAEAARRAAEEENKRQIAGRDQLAREREAAKEEARQQAEIREKEAAEAEARRLGALAELAKLEQAKREQAGREALRLAALKRQQELEAKQKYRPVRVDYWDSILSWDPYYLNIGVRRPNPEDAVRPVPLR